MNLEQLEQEIGLIVSDKSLASLFKSWINQAISELAAEFELPALKTLTPTDLVVTTSNWLYDMPATYAKKLLRCASTVLDPDNWSDLEIRQGTDKVDILDLPHTQTGDAVSVVGVTERSIGVYPLANDTMKLWYYKKCEVLVKPSDPVLCIPPEFQPRVIIPKVVIKNFRVLQDLMINPPHQSLQWWMAEYSNGLYGSPRGDIGMINYFAKLRRPRRHGGRDPIP